MKNLYHYIGLGVVVIGFGIAAVINSYGIDSFDISKEQITAKMQEKLPITKSVPFYNITIKDITLDLGENRMNVFLTIVAVKKENDCAKNFTTKSAKMNKFLQRFRDKCEMASTEPSKIEVLVAGALDYRRPKVFFSPNSRDDIKIMTEFSDAFMIKHKKKVDFVLSEIAFRYLNRFPVYKFKNDTKQTIISAALESIEIHEDMVRINISYLELTKVLIGYIVMFIFVAGLVVLMAVTGFVLPFMDT